MFGLWLSVCRLEFAQREGTYPTRGGTLLKARGKELSRPGFRIWQCFVSQVSIKQCEFSQGMLLLHPWRHKRYGPVVATRPTRFGSNSMGGSGLVPQMLAIC
jgi:hypothetical protein